MVDDVGDLAWDQPRIDRMPHRAKTGDAVPISKCRKLFQASVATRSPDATSMTAQRIGQLPRATRRIR